RLRLALELGVGELHADHGGQALANVVARQVRVGVLEHARPARPVVQRAGERSTEAGDMRPAVHRVDVVREGQHVLGVRVVVLERDLDGRRPFALLDVDRALVERLLVAVQVPHERHQAAFEVERPLPVDPLVAKRDPDALREVRGLAEALRDRVERVVDRLEHLRVGEELGRRPAAAATGPIFLTGVFGLPRTYSWLQTLPSRADSTRIHDDSALTTLTPTPCRPPDTL